MRKRAGNPPPVPSFRLPPASSGPHCHSQKVRLRVEGGVTRRPSGLLVHLWRDTLFELADRELNGIGILPDLFLDEVFLFGRQVDADDLLFLLHGRSLNVKGRTV